MLETLKKHQLLENLNKCEFAYQTLVYLGYMIGGEEPKIDHVEMEATIKWLVPTKVSEVRSFIGATQCVKKSIASFLAVVSLLHSRMTSGKSFHWGRVHKRPLRR